MKFIAVSLLHPFIFISFIFRVLLIIYSKFHDNLTINISSTSIILLFGIINDFVAYVYIIMPILIFGFFIPISFRKFNLYKFLSYFFYYLWICILVFNCFAEFLFWEEFSTKFNFIAVDYLIYTREVIGNITESYPIPKLFSLIGMISFAVFMLCFKYISCSLKSDFTWKDKIKQIAVTSFAFVIIFIFYNPNYTDNQEDRYKSELNKNGIFSLFSAYWSNSLDYENFYQGISKTEAFAILKKELLQTNQEYLHSEINSHNNSIERIVKYQGPSKKHNVILIVVESLSKEFIGALHADHKSITPFLDEIAKDSIVFSNFYATGTRTVRGLEALTLSIPPTAGSSVVRRPGNENLFSLSTILKPLGYDMQFIYGGFGYFDNMNYFFENNGFRVVDRNSMTQEEISFSNAWGVSDENLFSKAIKEADKSHINGSSFFQLIMTTSNHRPFTFPENKIDLPSGEGRNAAVKYTDHALAGFIKEAKEKKWFDNTIFVITADHCASSAGKVQIPINKYHIPLYIYSPKILKPSVVSTISSQIDLPPTILGLLNITYNSKFFGNDIFTKNNDNLLLGTYQLLGFYQQNKFAILGPKKNSEIFMTNNFIETMKIEKDDLFLKKAISYYQVASYLLKNNLMK